VTNIKPPSRVNASPFKAKSKKDYLQPKPITREEDYIKYATEMALKNEAPQLKPEVVKRIRDRDDRNSANERSSTTTKSIRRGD